MNKTILIVDDNFRAFKSLTLNFKAQGYDTRYASCGEEALAALKRESFCVVLLDLMLGDEDGRDVLERIRALPDGPPVIMITGYAGIDSAVDSIKRGAYNYLQKPVDFDRLLDMIETVMAGETGGPRLQAFETELYKTRSPEMKRVMEKAGKLAATDFPVLILGENGTGKELMAEYIHQHSVRKDSGLHKINCAAFQESILDNELFGHNKGAYTGADDDFKGIFELADGQTLFMDEIGDMSLAIQAKILRTLQNSEIRRIGGNKVITVDVRFIAATNKDIEGMIADKEFRQDLYYRLNTAVVRIPPLRERLDDIDYLAEIFLKDQPGGADRSLSEEVIEIFCNYSWPGNVRELKNTIQYAAALSDRRIILPEDLPGSLAARAAGDKAFEGNVRERAEKDVILRTLKKHGYNKSRAAAELNMSRKTLYIKIEKYGIDCG
jgi:DNA-binding NtrC family response regulator